MGTSNSRCSRSAKVQPAGDADREMSLEQYEFHQRKHSKYVSTIRDTEFTKDDYDPYTRAAPNLTERQRELIRGAWLPFQDNCKQMKVVACTFTRMFIKAPESRALFGFLRVEDGMVKPAEESELLKNALLKKHLSDVMEFFDKTMLLMDDSKALQQSCLELGKTHAIFGAGATAYLKGFCEGLIFAIEKATFPYVDEEMMKAWEALCLIVAHYFAKGSAVSRRESVICTIDQTDPAVIRENLQIRRQTEGSIKYKRQVSIEEPILEVSEMESTRSKTGSSLSKLKSISQGGTLDSSTDTATSAFNH